MTKIAIIGVGELGWALGRILSNEEQTVFFWDRSEEQLMSHGLPSLSLPEVLKGADFVLLCVPSWNIKEVLTALKKYWTKDTTVLLFSKGLDPKTEKLPYEIAQKMLPASVGLAVVSGAMIAEEIAIGRFGACLIATKTKGLGERVAKIFEKTNIVALPVTDLKGVAWSGVLKNIYGLGLGIAEGLGWTINERGLLLGQSLEEILSLIKILGGKKETFISAPIIADLIVTSFAKHSLNHQVGLTLGLTGSADQKSEGLSSLAPLLSRLKKEPKNLPILSNLIRIIVKGEDPQKVFGKY